MEEIIAPVDKALILAELTPDRLQRKTNHGDNEIYVVNWQNAPNTVREIGRLREISFRQAGGSAGLAMDLDEFDTMDNPYQQLLVWDPDAQAIIGGYRYILGTDIRIGEDGQPVLATSHMFHFSEEFVRDYIPHTIELGRSFVTPEYQSSKAGAKALFALDNLWDGLATLKFFFPEDDSLDMNNRSAQTLLEYGSRRMMFTADMERNGQASLLSRINPSGLKADLLKYPHHGKSPLDDAFLQAVNPEAAIITNKTVPDWGGVRYLSAKGVPYIYTNQTGVYLHLVTDGEHWIVEQVPQDRVGEKR